MIDSVSFSLMDIPAYRRYRELYNQSNSTLSFQLWISGSKATTLYNEIENYIETNGQDVYHGDNNVDTLNVSRSIKGSTSSLFQTEDEDTYFEIDWVNGTVKKLTKSETLSVLGFEGEKQPDTIVFKNGKIIMTDYVSDNLDDGQDATTTSIRSSKYGNKVTFTTQEFDIDYVLNALYMDPDDPQYAIAKQILDDLFNNASAWLTKEEMNELASLKRQYGDTSAEYNKKLRELLINKLFDGKEIPEHSHLEKTTGNFVAGGDADDSAEGTVPVYEAYDVIKASGLQKEYDSNINLHGEWGSEGYRNLYEERDLEARNMMEPIINQLISALRAKLGDNWTSEMEKYCEKVKDELMNGLLETEDEDICDNQKIKKADVWAATDQKSRFLKSTKRCVVINVKNLCNAFFKKFDEMCKNKGKSSAEAAAEKEQKEKERAEQKESYRNLYNMSMSSAASEAKVPSSIQVANASSAIDFQEKAEEKIINPLKTKIKNKYAGKISDSELNAILEYATEAALANPSSWATQYNDYTYVINSSKVIEAFQNAVRSAIKEKFPDFN